MKKKLMLSAVSLGLAVCLCASLVACGGGYSETFTGAVSETTYVSVEDSVKGFLKEELSGMAAEAVLISYETTEELSAEQAVKELDLEEEYAEGLEKAEKVEVEYEEAEVSLQSISSLAAAGDAAKKNVRTFYVLGYQDGYFRYYVPMVGEGETLAASYFNSVFNAENYVNCTLKLNGTEVASYSNGKNSTKISEASAKYDGSVLYMKSQLGDYDAKDFIELYAIKSNDVGQIVSRSSFSPLGSDWSLGAVWSASIVDGAMMRLFDMYFGGFDHTCFEKTSTGYALKEGVGRFWVPKIIEKVSSYLVDIEFEQDVESYLQYVTKFDVNMEVFISEGRISKVNLTTDFVIDYAGKQTSAVEELVFEYSDFGTTVVNVPDEVKALVP